MSVKRVRLRGFVVVDDDDVDDETFVDDVEFEERGRVVYWKEWNETWWGFIFGALCG